jgi:hypothetical protein
MKVAAQVLLVIFFVILFFVGLISSAFKFQLLDYNFWQSTFQKNDVYQNLAVVSKDSFESQIAKEGGNKNDIKILTDLISKENAKDVVDRNIWNFLSFANGKSSQINIYLPVDKVPKSLLPKNISSMKPEISLSDLFTKFNFQNWQNLPWQELSYLGITTQYFFFGTVSLLSLIMILLILLTEKGSRFIGLGIAFVLSGSFTFLLVNISASISKAISGGLTNKSSIASVIAGVIIPPVVTEVIYLWQILATVLFAIGAALFFIKKPRYNNPK